MTDLRAPEGPGGCAQTLGGIPAVVLHVWNPAERMIADELSFEVIVGGTHGHTAMETDLLGTVANPLADHAQRPVLVVPTAPRNPE